MKYHFYNFCVLLWVTLFFYSCRLNSANKVVELKQRDSNPIIVGAMKNVMHKGELFATINIDTIANKKHLYGLGPLAYLTGEILIVDGKGYKAVVVNDTAMEVIETLNLTAPFFGYANIDSFTESVLPDSVNNLPELESYINQTTINRVRPFMFKIEAAINDAIVHIVNLTKGSKVSSPEEAHKGQRNYEIKDKNVVLIGFFSTKHQTIFTHHDTYLHIHLITEDKNKMGHLEQISFKKSTAKLFLPQ